VNNTLDAKIWAIAWPAIVANISIPLLGLVDAALLGHLDSPRHLGAVAIGSAILSFLYWGFGFLRMGTTGEVARAVGAGDREQALLALGRATLLAVAIAALLWLARDALVAAGLAVMSPATALEVLARDYVLLRLASAPAVLVTYTIVGWFIGHQDTRVPMRIVIAVNITNILLDALFIAGLGMASRGAALATVIAEYLGLLLGLWALREQLAQRPRAAFWRALAAPRAYLAVLGSNLNLFLRTLALLFAFAFFTATGERLGPTVLAANAVMIQFLLFAAFALDGFAYAAEGLAGEALGARDGAAFRRVARRCAWWSGISALCISLGIALGRPLLFPLLTDIEAVRRVLDAQGLWLVLLPLVAAPSYLLDGLFIGAGRTRAMMLGMLVSVVAVYLPAWYLSRPLGNHGLWLAFTLFNAARGLTLAIAWVWLSRRGRWLDQPG
jgi:MATE family multidrug resistance protein